MRLRTGRRTREHQPLPVDRRGRGPRLLLPRNADVSVHERLARHAVAAREVLLGEVVALLRLDRIGVLDSLFDQAPARAAESPAALERDAPLLAQRDAEQVAVLRRLHHLAAARDERD